MFTGAYHYARFNDVSEARAEADWFLAHVELGATDWPMLDWEAGSGDPAAGLAWLQHVEQQTNLTPWLYTGPWFLALHQLTDPALARYPLCLAYYSGNFPPVPAPWTRIECWQFSSKGQVPGIVGPVDEDKWL